MTIAASLSALFVLIISNKSSSFTTPLTTGFHIGNIQKHEKSPAFSKTWHISTRISSSKESESEKTRMDQIRSIQRNFYTTPPSTESSTFYPSGRITNLPLWRVQWSELPGRSNILVVFEGRYTHMFETLLHTPPPWYFGHLFLPGGSANLNRDGYRLNWYEDEDRPQKKPASSGSVVGTLMRVVDYRRMGDGKLFVYVQAVERFVVSHSVRESPYSVADVQILPDLEEIGPCGGTEWDCFDRTEDNVRGVRAEAVRTAFHWHDYEYDSGIELPMKPGDDISVSEISGVEIAKLMPFAPFSDMDPKILQTSEPALTPFSDGGDDDYHDLTSASGILTFEKRLMERGIFTIPDGERDGTNSNDDMEEALWIAMDEFLRIQKNKDGSSKNIPIPPELLCLLPHAPPHEQIPDNDNDNPREWPRPFVLDDAAKHIPFRVTEDYPAVRRQRMLSYSAVNLLERSHLFDGGALMVEGIRQKLLEIPDTRSRLKTVLEYFLDANRLVMGEFL